MEDLPDDSPGRLPLGDLDGLLDVVLVRDGRLVAIDTTRGSQDDNGTRSLNALSQSIGSKTAEDNSMNSTETVDGKDTNEGSRDHGHLEQSVSDSSFIFLLNNLCTI